MAKKKRSAKKSSTKDEDTKLFAFLATFLSIVGVVLALATKKDNKFVMFYAKQSLVVFLVFVVGWLVMIVPFFGWIIGGIVHIFGLILWVISWIFALSDEMKEVPLVGTFAKNFKF